MANRPTNAGPHTRAEIDRAIKENGFAFWLTRPIPEHGRRAVWAMIHDAVERQRADAIGDDGKGNDNGNKTA